MRNAKSRRGNQILAAAVGAVGVMGMAIDAQAAGITFQSASGNPATGGAWATAASWTANSSYPGTSDTANIVSAIAADNSSVPTTATVNISNGGLLNIAGGSRLANGTISVDNGTINGTPIRTTLDQTTNGSAPSLEIKSGGATFMTWTNATYDTFWFGPSSGSVNSLLVWSGTGKLTVDAKNTSNGWSGWGSGTFSSVAASIAIVSNSNSTFSGDIDVITGRLAIDYRQVTSVSYDGVSYADPTKWNGHGNGNIFVASGAKMEVNLVTTVVVNDVLKGGKVLSGAGTFNVGSGTNVATLRLFDTAALAPGQTSGGGGIGTLTIGTVAGDEVRIDSGADLKLDWDSGTDTMDKLVVTGAMKSGTGTGTVYNDLRNLDVIVSGAGVFGTHYQVLTVGSASAWGSVPNSNAAVKSISAGWEVWSGNTSATSLYITPVPEPASAMGLLAPGALMALRRRRRS